MFRKNQRKTVVVDPALQLRIVLVTSLPMFACLVLATALEFLYRSQIDAGRIPSYGTIFGFPEDRLGMLLLFVSASSVQLTTSLLASQKVAGASYRIGRTLEAFRGGDRDIRVRLRKGDFQNGLADDLNDFLEWVEKERFDLETGAADAPGRGRTGDTPGAEPASPASRPHSSPPASVGKE